MKKMITLATLLQLSSASASVMAILDTGTDISHKDLVSKIWINKSEKVGSKTDLDGSGLPGDVFGWDFTENSAIPFNNKYDSLISSDVKRFYKLYAKYETKTISAVEFEWLKGVVANEKFMHQANFVGGYAHGTHVGGISADKNPKVELLSLKILPTVYKEYVAPVAKSDKGTRNLVMRNANSDQVSFEELKKVVINSAVEQIKEMIGLHTYVNFQKADIANESFGIGFLQAADFLNSGFIQAMGRQPTQDELVEIIVLYFSVMRQVGPAMFDAAPNTLFVIAAGNDKSNNDELPDYPADIPAANKIVVAATLGYSELADFSNFGATKVEVAAPGVAIEATGPNQSYLQLSGTSQAAPFVANAASFAKDINPKLTAVEIKRIIMGTVDVKSWLKDKVLTSGIVNKERVKRAAELSLTTTVDEAIEVARQEVLDVAIPKSFRANRPAEMKLNYRPLRPSLLVKLPVLAK